ncbi:MAG TPA: MFS transporter [Nitrososphaerales archaeon]|nr:MFS transporter [Nitrososphaerales archaeon]
MPGRNFTRIIPSIVASTLQGNILVMAISGLLTGSYTGMLNTILQPFTLSVGLSLATLGILQSLGNRTGGLAGSIVQPVGGYLSELFGRRAVVRAGSALAIIAMSFFLLAAVTHISLILVPAYLLYGSSLLSLPASQVLIAESVGLDYGRMKIAYSIVFLFSNIPAAFTSFFGGIIADSLGYYVIFASAVSLEAVNFVLYSARLKETNRPIELSSHGTRRQDVIRGIVKRLTGMLTPPRGLWGYFATFAVDLFAFSITGYIIYGMIATQYHYSDATLGLISGVYFVVLVLGQVPATRLMLKIGAKKSIAISESLSVVQMLSLFFARTLPAFVAFAAIWAFTSVAWQPAAQSMLMTVAPNDRRAEVAGKLAAFRGIIAFPAPIIGGILFQEFGFGAPPVASAIGAFCALIMIIKFLPREE